TDRADGRPCGAPARGRALRLPAREALWRGWPGTRSGGLPAETTDGSPMRADALDPRRSRALREELPGVHDAFDERLMRRHLQAGLFEDDGHRYVIDRCERGKAAYVPGEGCVVRYAIEVRDRVRSRVTPALVSARLFPSARSSRIHFESCLTPLAVAMRGRGDVAPFATPVAVLGPLSMTVPRSFGFVEPLRLLLLEAIPGVPRIVQLLRERLNKEPGADRTPTLEDATDWAARVAAGLHTSGIGLGPSRRAEDELIELKQALAVLERVSPGLAAGFQEWLDSVAACAAASNPWPACFSHGDFSPSQLVFSGDQCGLIDFDTVCQAEPALDL